MIPTSSITQTRRSPATEKNYYNNNNNNSRTGKPHSSYPSPSSGADLNRKKNIGKENEKKGGVGGGKRDLGPMIDFPVVIPPPKKTSFRRSSPEKREREKIREF